MKQSEILSWFNKSTKKLLPKKGESTIKVILKLLLIIWIVFLIFAFLPIFIAIVLFFLVKEKEFKNEKIKTGLLIAIPILGIGFSFLFWGTSSSDDISRNTNIEQSGSSGASREKAHEENDLSILLSETKAKINDFNENLTIASNYGIDVDKYSDINNLDINDDSLYEEIEKVLGMATTYNEDLEKLIDEAKDRTYNVTKVVDGDTIKIEYKGSEESVRLIGIDTPETVHPNEPVGCFGEEASNKMKELVSGKNVRIMFDSSQGSQDKYGRLLLYIWVGETFVNKKMIEDGYAYEYTYSTPYIYQNDFKVAQEDAKSLEKGLWGDVCACEKEEIKKSCTTCKTATVTYQNWDCSTYTKTVSDISCTSGCTTSTPTPSPTYVCDCSKTCTQISTCAEAYYQLNTCGCSRRDGDKDGIPCDSMCQ